MFLSVPSFEGTSLNRSPAPSSSQALRLEMKSPLPLSPPLFSALLPSVVEVLLPMLKSSLLWHSGVSTSSSTGILDGKQDVFKTGVFGANEGVLLIPFAVGNSIVFFPTGDFSSSIPPAIVSFLFPSTSLTRILFLFTRGAPSS